MPRGSAGTSRPARPSGASSAGLGARAVRPRRRSVNGTRLPRAPDAMTALHHDFACCLGRLASYADCGRPPGMAWCTDDGAWLRAFTKRNNQPQGKHDAFHTAHGGVDRCTSRAGHAGKTEMPHYFIDTQDGEHCINDEDGIDLPGLREACDEAVRVLPGIAHDLLSRGNPRPCGGRLELVSTVRDERGLALFRAAFSLSTERLAPDPASCAEHRPDPGR